MPELETIELKTGDNPDTVVIWLHGLGADGNDFLPIVQELKLPAELAIHFIFPNAPSRPITINQGYRMPGWYDVTSLNITDREDVDGINESSRAVAALCQQAEERGIRPERILLAGFSQGGAIALHCGLQYPARLAGIIALSTYLPRCVELESASCRPNRSIPIFMAHGNSDDVIAPVYAARSMEKLRSASYPVEWHTYPMAHSVSMEEIEDIQRWLLQILT